MNKPSKDLSNSNKQLWFKAKHYGWGWYPCTWQGWLVVAIYLAVFIPIVRYLANQSTSTGMAGGLLAIGISVLILIIICYKKGEKPCWRWGNCKTQ
jgi:hypothetical protein